MAVYPTYEIAGLSLFRFWCQKVLPAVYDDSLTYYELLCKVIEKLNELIEKDNEQSDVINLLVTELEELRTLFDKFQESGFDDYYKEQVDKWIDEHLRYIYEKTTAAVFFGLTDDGYFCSWIPHSWRNILFDTEANYENDNYGHLILKY